ncbi:MAG: ATPase [Chloroflexi bacterium]|nr:ATPase [Chloroflexota bacterium]
MPSSVLVAMRVKATPERAFEAFTGEIGVWWKPNGLFQFTPRDSGVVAFEMGEGGRFSETLDDGSVFEIGRISVWAPPHRLVFSSLQASFTPEQSTYVHVRFEAAGDETRVTVEHFGWDTVPQQHVARHGFPLSVFLQRHAEW